MSKMKCRICCDIANQTFKMKDKILGTSIAELIVKTAGVFVPKGARVAVCFQCCVALYQAKQIIDKTKASFVLKRTRTNSEKLKENGNHDESLNITASKNTNLKNTAGKISSNLKSLGKSNENDADDLLNTTNNVTVDVSMSPKKKSKSSNSQKTGKNLVNEDVFEKTRDDEDENDDDVDDDDDGNESFNTTANKTIDESLPPKKKSKSSILQKTGSNLSSSVVFEKTKDYDDEEEDEQFNSTANTTIDEDVPAKKKKKKNKEVFAIDPGFMSSKASQNQDSNLSTINNESKIPCLACGKQLSNRAKLERHMEKAHKKPEGFDCPNCGGMFRSKEKFDNHIFNEKCNNSIFPCQEVTCNKKFTNMKTVQSHMKKFHPLSIYGDSNEPA